MGRYLVQYGIPLLILLPFAWLAVRWVWLKAFPKVIEGQAEMNKATERYAAKLSPKTKVKKKTVEEPFDPKPVFFQRKRKYPPK